MFMLGTALCVWLSSACLVAEDRSPATAPFVEALSNVAGPPLELYPLSMVEVRAFDAIDLS